MNKALEKIKADYGLDITNKSVNDILLFNVNNNRDVFKTYVEIYFSGITGQEGFRVNIPAGDCSLERYSEIQKAFKITTYLNEKLSSYRNCLKK